MESKTWLLLSCIPTHPNSIRCEIKSKWNSRLKQKGHHRFRMNEYTQHKLKSRREYDWMWSATDDDDKSNDSTAKKKNKNRNKSQNEWFKEKINTRVCVPLPPLQAINFVSYDLSARSLMWCDVFVETAEMTLYTLSYTHTHKMMKNKRNRKKSSSTERPYWRRLTQKRLLSRLNHRKNGLFIRFSFYCWLTSIHLQKMLLLHVRYKMTEHLFGRTHASHSFSTFTSSFSSTRALSLSSLHSAVKWQRIIIIQYLFSI